MRKDYGVQFADQIVEFLNTDQSYSEDKVDEVIAIVHPGLHLRNDEELPDGVGLRDYAEYDRKMSFILEEKDPETPVYIIYSEGEKEARDFFSNDFESLDNVNFVSSSKHTGKPKQSSYQDYAEIFNGLKDDSVLRIEGEYHGLCRDNNEDLIDEIRNAYPHDFEIRSEITFPEDKLARTQGKLHWEDEEPAQVKLLDARSKF